MPAPLPRVRRVALMLPALTEATSPCWRPIKYSLFPPLGLATLAAYLDPDLHVSIVGIMNNGSFVFGHDGDGRDVFARPVDWAVRSGITTATFHVLPPYPGTALYADMAARDRIVTRNWGLYDTRHVVYRPARLSSAELERGYHQAYRSFYRWGSIVAGPSAHRSATHVLKHLAYAAGWKKFEPAWDLVIRIRQLAQMRPLLEAVLAPVGNAPADVRATFDTRVVRLACRHSLSARGARHSPGAPGAPPQALPRRTAVRRGG